MNGVLPITWPDGDEVHVWLAFLDQLPDVCASHDGLSPSEADRAARFRSPQDRRQYVGRCVTLRRLLARYGLDLGRREVPTADGGKPYVSENLRFSLSQSGDVVLIALANGQEVGADVERVRPLASFEAFCDGALTPAERAELMTVPEQQRLRVSLWLWTAKEAVLKASGDGLAVDPRLLGFAGEPPERPWRPWTPPGLVRLAEWRVTHLMYGDAIGAIAVRRDRWRLRLETMPSAGQLGDQAKLFETEP